MKKADIGLIGLAVMGENLVMNMESRGFTVAVFNRTTEKVDRFVSGRAAGRNIIGCHSLEELVEALEKPRKVFMMVKAGNAVDAMIEQLLPLLQQLRACFCSALAQRGGFDAADQSAAQLVASRSGTELVQAADSLQTAIDDLAANASAGAVIGYLAMKLR